LRSVYRLSIEGASVPSFFIVPKFLAISIKGTQGQKRKKENTLNKKKGNRKGKKKKKKKKKKKAPLIILEVFSR